MSLRSAAQLLWLTSELLLIVWLACRLFCCRPAPGCAYSCGAISRSPPFLLLCAVVFFLPV
ncbi:hypothetical protein A4R35_11995 [Thermogemmatispora tikiterensis]|uniref:Uncharacterized protein n=1 Tax=Thermogemmatispora tikiterensis TaxID=1825093 RepID=A0A328VFD0_9CHLR|nr:hypothetical protein A4R35_11995 [Thermogemmatispora tikiterensis]